MLNFIIKKLCWLIISLFILSIILYWIHYRLDMGNADSILVNYLEHTLNFFKGNFGVSIKTGMPIITELKTFLPPTIELIIISFVLAFFIGTIVGIISGLKHYSLTDKIVRTFCQFSSAIPIFWLVQILIMVFAIHYQIFPTRGNIDLLLDVPPITGFITIDALLTKDNTIIYSMLNHIFIPLLCVFLIPCTDFMLQARKATIKLGHKLYIRANLCRGINIFSLIYKHVLPNILPTILPSCSIILCNVVSTCILVEVMLDWPGIGPWLLQSVLHSDYSVLESVTFMLALVLLFIKLFIDIIVKMVTPYKANK